MAITTNAEVAGKVRAAAAEKRLSQAELADELRISRMAMSRRFSGETPFAPEELIRLSRRFEVPVAVFFGELAVTS